MTSLFLGSWNSAGTSSSVYEWSGEREEWKVHGNIGQGRGYAGVSLVSLSSGIMDHCVEDFTEVQVTRNKEQGGKEEGAEWIMPTPRKNNTD